MLIECSECKVWFNMGDLYDKIDFYTRCPSCKSYLDIKINVEVTKRADKY